MKKDYTQYEYELYQEALSEYEGEIDEPYLKQIFSEYGIKIGVYIYEKFDFYFKSKQCLGGYALLLKYLPSKEMLEKIIDFYIKKGYPASTGLGIEFGIGDGIKTYLKCPIEPQYYAVTNVEYKEDMKKVLELRKRKK